jgi:antibiotic biosynthesis monooxygenase (ABM) superfamily enzyme
VVATTSGSKAPPSIVRRLSTFRHSRPAGYSSTANLHTVFLTFDNIDSLNDWMMSPRRKALMNQLEPLLAVPDQELIQAERAAQARDAFTNLSIQQGQNCPTLPPKKWKVWWLTTVALVATIRWATSFLSYYMEFWGLNESHPRLRMLVIIFIVTFMNSYIMTPFLLFLFHPWLIRRSNEIDERFIWKTLNDGIQSMWLKFLLTFVFYGGCIIAWIAQTYTNW